MVTAVGCGQLVLIPGAGRSAWVWSRFAEMLREAGHEVISVDLPGDDPTAGLTRYAELVVEAVSQRSDVVLVAGSLGGFTLPLVCERMRVISAPRRTWSSNRPASLRRGQQSASGSGRRPRSLLPCRLPAPRCWRPGRAAEQLNLRGWGPFHP